MDEIISKLSSIEESAASIMDQANAVKKEISEKYSKKTADWDAMLESETDTEIKNLQENMHKKVESDLSQQLQLSQKALEKLQVLYDKQHNDIVNQLFTQMTKE